MSRGLKCKTQNHETCGKTLGELLGTQAELSDPKSQGKVRKGKVYTLNFRNKPALIGPA